MNERMEQELQQYLFQYESELSREAETLSLSDFPALTEELFSLFEKTGNRLQYENAYFGRRKYLVVFALNALLAKEQCIPAEISKLEWVLEQICEETCWALPAHVNREQDAEWKITLDLFACETAQSLLEIAFLLRNDLRSDLLRRIWEESNRRRMGSGGKRVKATGTRSAVDPWGLPPAMHLRCCRCFVRMLEASSKTENSVNRS